MNHRTTTRRRTKPQMPKYLTVLHKAFAQLSIPAYRPKYAAEIAAGILRIAKAGKLINDRKDRQMLWHAHQWQAEQLGTMALMLDENESIYLSGLAQKFLLGELRAPTWHEYCDGKGPTPIAQEGEGTQEGEEVTA